MNLTFYINGQIKESYYLNFYQEYKKRLSRFAKTEIVMLPDFPLPLNPSEGDICNALEKEGSSLLKRIKKDDFVIVLSLDSLTLDSIALANKISDILTSGFSHLLFVIGSSYGLSQEVKNRANLKLQLSTLTFTHPLALCLSLEMVYRSFKIINHEKYHK